MTTLSLSSPPLRRRSHLAGWLRGASVVAAALVAACGHRPDVGTLFVPANAVEFRLQGDAAWKVGRIGTAGRCTQLFQPSPPPPQRAVRFITIDLAEVTDVRIRADSTAAWTKLDVGELRRAYGNCSPL